MTAEPALLLDLQPVLNPGTFVFASVPGNLPVPSADIIASIREPEGMSVILEESAARWVGLSPAFECAWITLMVHSDLDAVGITAEVSSALARAGISCNVVAGLRHDHIFVPIEQAGEAMCCLKSLSAAVPWSDRETRGEPRERYSAKQ